MKHAYLIIAHNEFEVLKRLVSALDDVRNDIYVHIDKKVKTMPELHVKLSGLYVLDKRIDVRWGHVSQIKTELLLFETALKNGPYEFYHLISGTHLPLKSQDEIHSYIGSLNASCVLPGMVVDTPYQETLKMRRVNLFLKNYSSRSSLLRDCSQFCWKAVIAIERTLGIEINKGESFYKASNWLVLNEDALTYIVDRKKQILKKYRFSLCGDEFFVPSELMQSRFKDSVVDSPVLLKQEMMRANPRVYHYSDLVALKESGYLFARKFTSDL